MVQVHGTDSGWRLQAACWHVASSTSLPCLWLFWQVSANSEWGGQRCFLVMVNLSNSQILKALLAIFQEWSLALSCFSLLLIAKLQSRFFPLAQEQDRRRHHDGVFWTSKLLYLKDRGSKVKRCIPFASTPANVLIQSCSISSCSTCSLAQVRWRDVKTSSGI